MANHRLFIRRNLTSVSIFLFVLVFGMIYYIKPGFLFNDNGLLPGVNNVTCGIKGYFATVKMSTDNSTDPFGPKELFAVGSSVMKSYP